MAPYSVVWGMLMKIRDLTSPVDETLQKGGERQEVGVPVQAGQADETPDVIGEAQLLRILEAGRAEFDDPGDTANLPRITRMPEGIEVIEQRAGIAEGQWILQVRCQCGRRWFELEAIPVATCPRCGLLVYLNVAVPGPPA
jgi:hypothetical protein